ncbi:MAG: hypothetical protein M1402_04300 [Candidatus Thermoplasmatota archaeon]|nr:hypothetical protein [Candidatus Thermoplasmatota archaeon]
MDCPTLISQIKNKYIKIVKVVENKGSEDLPSQDYLSAQSEFLRWFEEIIKNASVENGELSMSAKQCILSTINEDGEGNGNQELIEALSLFSDKRILELFGVKIFSD